MFILPRVIPPNQRVTVEPWNHTQTDRGNVVHLTIHGHGLKQGDRVTCLVRGGSGDRRYRPTVAEGVVTSVGLNIGIQMVEDR